MMPDRRFTPDVTDAFTVSWPTPGIIAFTTCIWRCVAREPHIVIGVWIAGERGHAGARIVFSVHAVRFHAVRPETIAAAQGAPVGSLAGRAVAEAG